LQGQTLEVRRREGCTLYFQCPYTAGITAGYTKYFCRLKDGRCEEVLRVNNDQSRKSNDGRITVKDDSARMTVLVTMTDLKAEDSDIYFCIDYYYTVLSSKVSLIHIKPVPVLLLLPVWDGLQTHPTLVTPFLSSSCNENTFTILSVVLLVLLLLALVTCTALGVRLYRLLRRAPPGNGEAEDASDRPEGTAQPGSTGKRESSQDDSKGPAYINLDVQSQPSPEDPLYCNVELSQAHRNPQHVEYAIIAFKQSPRSSRE
ncbi:CLM3 protein, partial [Regulus satrapa]|nr:CLM3 protein [Regulus satrapa]